MVVIVAGALLAVVVISPVVQTWVAESALNRQPGVQASMAQLSAGFGKVEVTDLHLDVAGAVLTLPALEAGLPLTTAVWQRKVLLQRLVAKGWTLDLSRVSDPAAVRSQPAPVLDAGLRAGALAQFDAALAQSVLRIFHGILSGWELPCDVSLDGIDLEGDVLIGAAPGTAPAKLHVILKGGGVAAGREGDVAIEAKCSFLDSNVQIIGLTVRGRLAVAMGSPRTLNHIGIKADLAAIGGPLAKELAVSFDLTAARSAEMETYSLDVNRGGRRLASFQTRFSSATGRLAGSWKIDAGEAEVASLDTNRPLPAIAAVGEGDFETDAAFTQVRGQGRLKVVASRLGVLAPVLESLGTATFEAQFDAVRQGHSVRVNRLSFALAGAKPVVTVQSLQSFEVDERTGALAVADPKGDWMEASIGGLPLAWLSGRAGDVTLAGGDASGEFVVQAAKGGFALRPKSPLTATGVTVQHQGRVAGQGLDLSLSLLADVSPEGWRVQCSPFTIDRGGRRIASLEAKASRSVEAGRPIEVSGSWNVDFVARESQAAIPALSWLASRSASGEFSARVGSSTSLEGRLTVLGPEPDQTITASGHADVGPSGAIAFAGPVKITVGASVSDVSADGAWKPEKVGGRINVRLEGKNAVLEHMRLLAASLAAAGGVPWIAKPSAGRGATPPDAAGGTDRIPFWGDWAGRVAVDLEQVKAGDREFKNVRGSFELDHGSVRLENGGYALADRGRATVEGTVAFEPGAAAPYRLNATAALGEVEASSAFGASPKDQDPMFKGRFTVASTFKGIGKNLEDLIGRTEQEFRLASKGGIVRLFKTQVADSIAEPTKPVSDFVGSVASLMGPIFGVDKSSAAKGVIRLDKNTEAVLNFSYQVAEIGYSQIAITANRGSDGTIRLVEIAMTAPDERVTGSGRIGHVEGQPFAAAPLSVDLQLGVRGQIAELLSTSGLLSAQKDDQGYTLFNQPIHFGGTLQKIDDRQWHDLLAEAANLKPEGGKKSGGKDAGKK